jgi:signal transduction histidine kinase
MREGLYYKAPLRDASGNIMGLVGTIQDVTERNRDARDLERAKRDAEAATEAKGRFLANMSHELRTPMNAVLGMLKLLQTTELTARQLDYATKTESAAKSLLGLLNDILDFSKMEAGKMELDPQPYRLDRLLRDLAVVLSATVGNKNVEVLYDLAPDMPEVVVGDAMRLRQVLINLAMQSSSPSTARWWCPSAWPVMCRLPKALYSSLP